MSGFGFPSYLKFIIYYKINYYLSIYKHYIHIVTNAIPVYTIGIKKLPKKSARTERAPIHKPPHAAAAGIYLTKKKNSKVLGNGVPII